VPGGTPISVNGLPTLSALFPAFSTDNAHVAFNFYGGTAKNSAGTTFTGDLMSLASMDYAPSTTTFSNFQILATPATGNVGVGSGTVALTHSSNVLTFSTPQTLPVSTSFVFSSVAGTSVLSASIEGSTTANINHAYTGSTTAAATWWYGGHIYHPSYLPTNNQIVWEDERIYNGRDTGGTRSDSDSANNPGQNDGTHAELWWTDVPSLKSAPLVNLNGGTYLPSHPAALIASGDNQLNYEPNVNPQNTGGYSWVIFTSRRVYGNIATINPYWSDPRYQNVSVQPTPKKLWVSAINPSAAAGTDPSFPAFYLPGQELLAGNSSGYWALAQCEQAGPPTSANLCASTLDCCPASPVTNPAVVCALDAPPATTSHCTTTPSNSCSANGGACATSNQCCQFPASVCAQSVCAPAQTLVYSTSHFASVYNGSTCPVGTLVSWVDVGLEALTPSSGGTNSAIAITAQVGTTSTVFTPSTPVAVGTLSGPPANQSATWNNFPLSPALATISSQAEVEPYLNVTLTLTPTNDKLAAPTIVDWRVRFDCLPSE